MALLTSRPVIIRDDDGSPASKFRGIIRKSALLNVVVVLTSLTLLVAAGEQRSLIPALALMSAITILIWTITFILISCVSIGRLVWMMFCSETRRKPRVAASRAGLGDHWLDGPG